MGARLLVEVADISPDLDAGNMAQALRTVEGVGGTRKSPALELDFASLEACEKLQRAIRELRASELTRAPLLIEGDLATALVLIRAIVAPGRIVEVLCALLGSDRSLLERLPDRVDADALLFTEAQRLSEHDQQLLFLIAERGTVRHDGKPLGGRLVVHVDGRVKSALASGGRFFRITVPRLCEHPADAGVLLESLLKKRLGDHVRLTDGAKAYLAKQPWTGDVPELLQLAERLVFQRETASLPDVIDSANIGAQRDDVEADVDAIKPGTHAAMMAEFESRILKRALEAAGWNKSAVAKQLGISRSYLIQKCSYYGLETPDPGWTWKRHRAKAG